MGPEWDPSSHYKTDDGFTNGCALKIKYLLMPTMWEALMIVRIERTNKFRIKKE